MQANKSKHATAADSTGAVEQFMQQLEHPFKAEVDAIRQLVLAVDPGIHEGIKWNSPSFRTTEYFATINLRQKNGIGVILHLGAKVRDDPPSAPGIDDPHGLLSWLAKDRASVVFKDLVQLNNQSSAFQTVLGQWIKHV